MQFDLDGLLSSIEKKDTEKLLGYLAEDVAVYAEDVETAFKGKEALRAWMDAALPSLGEVHIHKEFALQQGDEVAALLHMSASYVKDVSFVGVKLPLKGRSIDLNAAVFLRLNEEGKVGRMHRVRDNRRVMKQLGISEEQYDKIAEKVAASPQG